MVQQFQGLNIGNETNTTEASAPVSVSTTASVPLVPLVPMATVATLAPNGIEMDGEGGWTMLDDDKVM